MPPSLPPRFFDTQEKRDILLHQVLGVGSQKPMGFLSASTIKACGADPHRIALELDCKGPIRVTHTALTHFQNDASDSSDFTLVVVDQVALGNLLVRHARVVSASGWPMKPDSFADRVMREIAPKDDPINRVIAHAFNDPLTLGTGEWVRSVLSMVREGFDVKRPGGGFGTAEEWRVRSIDRAAHAFNNEIRLELSSPDGHGPLMSLYVADADVWQMRNKIPVSLH